MPTVSWLPPVERLVLGQSREIDRIDFQFRRRAALCPVIFGRPILFNLSLTSSGACQSCWHTLSREASRRQRVFDEQRASRALWCFSMFENANDPEILHWVDLHEGHERRLYLWLESAAYVVILVESTAGDTQVYNFVTGFVVTDKGYERTLKKSRARRVGDT